MNTSMHHDYKAVGLPLDDEGPVFDKPWQAQAFSLLVHLHQAGVFPWKDWVQVFSEEIKAAPAQPGETRTMTPITGNGSQPWKEWSPPSA